MSMEIMPEFKFMIWKSGDNEFFEFRELQDGEWKKRRVINTEMELMQYHVPVLQIEFKYDDGTRNYIVIDTAASADKFLNDVTKYVNEYKQRK